MNCRVCDCEVSDIEWRQHVESHKRAYCREFGNNPKLWYMVEWEDVVFHFNPKNITKKNIEEGIAEKKQMTLKELMR